MVKSILSSNNGEGKWPFVVDVGVLVVVGAVTVVVVVCVVVVAALEGSA